MSSFNPYNPPGSNNGRGREYGGDGDRNTQLQGQQPQNSSQQMGYPPHFPPGVPPPVHQQQYMPNLGNPYQRNVMPPVPSHQTQPQQQSYSSHTMTNPPSNPYQPQQQYTASPNPVGYNNRPQLGQGQHSQQLQQQTDYSKYQFLPYGQPTPPPTQQQQYNYYGGAQGQQGQYPYPPPHQQQQQYAYQANLGTVAATGSTSGVGYSYPSYGQQTPQGQGSHPGNYFVPAPPQQQQYPPSYSVSNSNGYQPGMVPAPVPVPVPAPVPPPVMPVLKEKKADSKKSIKKEAKKEGQGVPQEPEWDRKRPAQEEEQRLSVPEPEPKEIKKSVPIMVGKRRGGRTLPTGVVKKQKAASPEPSKRTDAWSQYMSEVKRYKDRSCEDERKNRPLVK